MCNVNLETSFAGTNKIKILKKIFIRLFILTFSLWISASAHSAIKRKKSGTHANLFCVIELSKSVLQNLSLNNIFVLFNRR